MSNMLLTTCLFIWSLFIKGRAFPSNRAEPVPQFRSEWELFYQQKASCKQLIFYLGSVAS